MSAFCPGSDRVTVIRKDEPPSSGGGIDTLRRWREVTRFGDHTGVRNRDIPLSPSHADEISAPIPTAPSSQFFQIPRCFPTYRWWRPITETAIFLIGFGILSVICVVAAALAFDDTAMESLESLSPDLTDPPTVVVAMVSLIVIIPAVFAAIGMVGKRPIGSIVSIWGRFRFRLFVEVTGISVALYSVMVVGILLTQPAHVHFDVRALFLFALILVLVPFQAAAEEIMFRGFLGQIIGSWTRSPALAMLLPVPLFVMGHDYNWMGSVSIAVFAVCAGVLAWATGGLEAPIAVHAVNNIVGLSLGAFGLTDAGDVDFTGASVLLDVGMSLVLTVLILMYVRGSSRRDDLGVPCLKFGRDLVRAG